MTTIDKQAEAIAHYERGSLTAGSVKSAAKEAGAGSSDLYKVPLDAFVVLPNYNLRIRTKDYDAKIKDLAQSIVDNGFYNSKPISVYVASVDGKNVFTVQDGHRRLEAAKLAKEMGADITEIPAIAVPRSMNEEEQLVHMLKSNEGEPFKVYELALAAARFQRFGKDDKQIAALMGFTGTYVKNLLTLAGAPKEIRAMVEAGDISPTFAIETVQKHKEKATEVIKEAKVRATEKGKKKATTKLTKAELEAKAVRLQTRHGVEAFKLLVDIMNKHGKHIDNDFHVACDALFVKCLVE